MTKTTLQEHIARVVAEAPPLTPAQRDRLTILFSPPPPQEERALISGTATGADALAEMMK